METQKRQVMNWTVVPVVSVDLRTSPGPLPLLPSLSILDSPHLSIWQVMVAELVAWIHLSFLGVSLFRPQLLQKSNKKSQVYHLGFAVFFPAPTVRKQPYGWIYDVLCAVVAGTTLVPASRFSEWDHVDSLQSTWREYLYHINK